jgi:hypothetical protein
VNLAVFTMTFDMMELDKNGPVKDSVIRSAEDFIKYAKDYKISLGS